MRRAQLSFSRRVKRSYFDWLYNPVYDSSTAQTHSYRRLQKACIDKLDLADDDRVLCLGVGTGNEVISILKRHESLKILGVDTSRRALRKTSCKTAGQVEQVNLVQMDVSELGFDDETFDKALCIHVMDFVDNSTNVVQELLRVLKTGGQFVATYPSAKEGLKLGCSLFRETLRNTSSAISLFPRLPLYIGAGIIYLPLLFRGNRRGYSPAEVQRVFEEQNLNGFQIQEDPLYQDLIIYGRK
ncbi:MAG: class I SAM-dependent methyltransferase [Dehalococcoidia bacterium]